jgi:hypothetical protein
MLRFVDSFDHYASGDAAAKYTSVASPTILTSGARTGTGCLELANSSASVRRDFTPADAEWIVGVAFKALTTLNGAGGVALTDAGTIQVHWRANTDGSITVYRGSGTGNPLGTTSGVTLSLGTWAYIELVATIEDSGSIELRVDGISRLVVAPIDTQATANQSADGVALVNGASGAVRFDDLYVCDGGGSVNNAPLGDRRVRCVLPNGDGAHNEWDCSTGSSRSALVDETPPTGDSDYVSSATIGDRQLCTFVDVGTLANVAGVQVTAMARKDDGGTWDLALLARPGSTLYSSSDKPVTSAYTFLSHIWETNPDTSLAWTGAGIDGAQFGFKVGGVMP